MADGFQQLDDMIARLRAAGRMVKDAAPDVAVAVERELKATLSRGESPDGGAWAATKKGGRALKRAANAVTVTAVDTVILARLVGHHVFHHFGTKRVPKRRVLPTNGLPESLGDAVKAGLVAWWKEEVED